MSLPQSPDEVKDKTGSVWANSRVLGWYPHSLHGEWVWEKGLGNVPSAGFRERKILYLFFSECSNSGRLSLSGPLKFRKEKRKKLKPFQRGKKTTNTPTLAKIKSRP